MTGLYIYGSSLSAAHLTSKDYQRNVSHHFATVPIVGMPGPTWQMFVWRSDCCWWRLGSPSNWMNFIAFGTPRLGPVVGQWFIVGEILPPKKSRYFPDILGNGRLLKYCNHHLDFCRDKGFCKSFGFISKCFLRIWKITFARGLRIPSLTFTFHPDCILKISRIHQNSSFGIMNVWTWRPANK